MINKLKGSILVFSGACSFGVLSTIVKLAYSHGFTLGEIVASQTFIGMLSLWILYIISRCYPKSFLAAPSIKQKDPHKMHHHRNKSKCSNPYLKLMGAGVFTGLVGIFYYQCVKLVPASVAIILLMQSLWMTVLIEALVFAKKPSRLQLISVLIVLLGTVMAAGLFESHINLSIEGVFFGLLAALSYSIFILTSGRLGNNLSVVNKSALMITGACFITFIIFPPIGLFTTLFHHGLSLWAIPLALFGTILPPFLFSKGVPLTGVSLGAILASAELPTAVILSAFILREHISFIQIAGVLTILFAIVLANIPLSKEA